jgi:hypothetical protein
MGINGSHVMRTLPLREPDIKCESGAADEGLFRSGRLSRLPTILELRDARGLSRVCAAVKSHSNFRMRRHLGATTV